LMRWRRAWRRSWSRTETRRWRTNLRHDAVEAEQPRSCSLHQARLMPRLACGLVETSRTHRLPGEDPRLLATFLTDRVRRPPRGAPVGPFFRRHEIQKYPALGGYEVIAVSAGARGRAPGPWEVAVRQILAVEPAQLPLLQPRPYKRIRARMSRYSHPTGWTWPRRGAALPVSALAAARRPRAGARLARGARRPPPLGGVCELPRRPTHRGPSEAR
jgi:hypothetical protein